MKHVLAIMMTLATAANCFAPVLVNSYRFGAAAFDPTLYGAVIAWYAARKETGFSDGDAVGTVTDFSSAAKNLAQATSSKKPTFKTSIVNGQSVFRFDGTDDVISAASAVASAPATVVVVAKHSAATFASFAGLVTSHDSGAGESGAFMLGNSGGTTFYNTGTTTSYWKDGTSFAEASMSAPMNAFAVCVIQASSGWSAVQMALGQDRGIASRFWNGDIAEVIIYSDAISTGNRQAVEAALKSLYGTP